MVERINITIPDALYERLRVVKEKINVSGTCQAAIERVVKLEEIKMTALSSREKLIERLRSEAKQTTEEWFSAGKESGLESIEHLSYEEFLYLEEVHENKIRHDRGHSRLEWQNLNDCAEEWAFLNWLRDEIDELSPPPGIHEPDYLAGWIEGVMEAWDDIKNEI